MYFLDKHWFFNTHGLLLKKRIVIETKKEEKIQNEIDKCLKAIGNKLPEKIRPDDNHIRPFFVSFDIPGTKNEAFLHIGGMDDEEVTLRLDVMRKGTQRVHSHYLKSYPNSEVELYLIKRLNREEIYESVIYLSKKADEYWDEQ